MKTAKLFWRADIELLENIIDGQISYDIATSIIYQKMKEFAAFHVKAALQAAADNNEIDITWLKKEHENLKPGEDYEVYILNSSILEAYPEKNIQ